MSSQANRKNNVSIWLIVGIFAFMLANSAFVAHAAESVPGMRPILIANLAELVKNSAEETQRQDSRKEIHAPQPAAAKPVIEAGKQFPMLGNEPVTLAWTNLELDMLVKHKIMPGRAARALAMMHVVMHNALVAARSGRTNSAPE
ncbi:MAG: hypothetical protein ABIU85_01820, partial [Methylotenera sp.]